MEPFDSPGKLFDGGWSLRQASVFANKQLLQNAAVYFQTEHYINKLPAEWWLKVTE
jgi:hypothetical protein